MNLDVEYRPLSTEERYMHYERDQRSRRGEDFAYREEDGVSQKSVFDSLLAAEAQLIRSPDSKMDYLNGTANFADEIHTQVNGAGKTVLVSSEHSTRNWRIDPETGLKSPKKSEPGTAGLGAVLARETDGTHIALIGKQTGNANFEAGHPYKDKIEALIRARRPEAFVSIHGMRAGLVSDLEDERPWDVLVGIGEEPNEVSSRAAETLLLVAEKLGLRAAINQPFLRIVSDEDGRLWQEVDKDGRPITNIFAAPDYTTRGTAQQSAQENGLNIPTMQVELSSALRVMPGDLRRDRVRSPIGPYLAHQALVETVRLITA